MKKTESGELAYVGENCRNRRVNAYYAGVHAISEKRYEEMINDYFKKVPRPKEYPVDPTTLKLWTLKPGQLCRNRIIKFEANDADDNSDIKVFPMDVMEMDGKYSIHFFRGLQRFFSPHRYEFSKAIGERGKTLVVRAVDQNEKTLYHGDLTHMYP